MTNWEYKSEVKHSKLSFKYPPSYRKDMEEYLKKIWYDPAHPGSFAGPSKLYQVVKQEGKFNVGMSKIKSFYKTKMLTPYKRKFAERDLKEEESWYRDWTTSGKLT